jgi:hypothetical protein
MDCNPWMATAELMLKSDGRYASVDLEQAFGIYGFSYQFQR